VAQAAADTGCLRRAVARFAIRVRESRGARGAEVMDGAIARDYTGRAR